MEYGCVYSFVGRRSTTEETTAAAAHIGVTAAHLRVMTHIFFRSRTLVVPGTFLTILYNNIHHLVAFPRELEEKEKNTEQDQPAVRSAVAAAAVAAAPPAAPPAAAAAAEVRFSMTGCFGDGQGKRGNVHTPAIMPVAFPDVVVFDGFI